MQETKTSRHSGLYYRNSFIVWASTILVFWFALKAPRNWGTMLMVLLGLYLNYFLWVTYRSVHPGKPIFRRRIPKLDVDLKAEKVEFFSRDGLQLCGWFLPGKKAQVIILLHGLGGSGLTMSTQARILVEGGYSVLMPDLRAHGDSEGDTITGIFEVNDVLGALDYLGERPDVDASQVGVSLGALIALRSARQSSAIQAVVLESIEPAKLSDHGGRPSTLWRWVNLPNNWLFYRLFDFMSGVETEEGVVEALRMIYPRPVLFVSTGRGVERYFMHNFYNAARHPKSIFEVPKASHGIAAAVESREYRERVLRILDYVF